jgi:hypothetical protein
MFDDLDKKNWREEEKKQGLKELKQLKEIVGFLLDQQQKYYQREKAYNRYEPSFDELHKKACEYKKIIDNFMKF